MFTRACLLQIDRLEAQESLLAAQRARVGVVGGEKAHRVQRAWQRTARLATRKPRQVATTDMLPALGIQVVMEPHG